MKAQKLYKQKICRRYGVNLWMTKRLTPKYLLSFKKKTQRRGAFHSRKPFGLNIEYRRLLSHLYGGLSKKYLKKLKINL